MRIHQFFATVTPVSKILAVVLFITLPFLGFWLGMEYQKSLIPTLKEIPPMTTEKFVPCDLDFDGNCDRDDYELFLESIHTCIDDPPFVAHDLKLKYNPLADVNRTGCVDGQDMDLLFPEYMTDNTSNQMPDADLANWKTYRNDEYGFEFEYPSILTVSEETNTVHLYTDWTIRVNTLKPETVTKPNFELIMQEKSGPLDTIAIGYKEGEIVMGDNTFSWYFDGAEGTGYSYYYLRRDTNHWMEFQTFSPGDELNVNSEDSSNPQYWDGKKQSETFKHILSTFRFVEEE